MLFDEAAKDIKQFYKEFVVPTMPRDMKLEVEGLLGITEVKNLLGEAIVTPIIDTYLVQGDECNSVINN